MVVLSPGSIPHVNRHRKSQEQAWQFPLTRIMKLHINMFSIPYTNTVHFQSNRDLTILTNICGLKCNIEFVYQFLLHVLCFWPKLQCFSHQTLPTPNFSVTVFILLLFPKQISCSYSPVSYDLSCINFFPIANFNAWS